MDIWPILYVHHKSGTIGMYEVCYSSEEEARAKIAELESEENGFEYATNAITLEMKWH